MYDLWEDGSITVGRLHFSFLALERWMIPISISRGMRIKSDFKINYVPFILAVTASWTQRPLILLLVVQALFQPDFLMGPANSGRLQDSSLQTPRSS